MNDRAQENQRSLIFFNYGIRKPSCANSESQINMRIDVEIILPGVALAVLSKFQDAAEPDIN